VVFKGTTATTATSTASAIPGDIISFSLANKTGGAITARVGILYGSTFYILYDKSIATADSYIYTGEPIRLEANHQVYISVSGSCDYYMTIM